MPTLTDFQSTITRYSGQFAELLHASDLESPVTSCPGWSMADLALHLSGTQRWATAIVQTGERAEHPVGPSDRPGLERWFSEGASTLVATLEATDPQKPAWNFGPEPRVAAFWSRRQAHEVAVHLWDAMHAQGRPFSIDAELAADGIDEVCSVFLFMKLRRDSLPDWAPVVNLMPADVPDCRVQLAAPDSDRDRPQVTLTGSASDLLLALWGRQGLEEVQVEGDRASVEALLGWGLTP